MDWVLSVAMIVGMVLIGNRSNKGNVVLMGSQFLWAWFAVSADHLGLLPLTIVLFFVYLRNWWKWRCAAEERLW